MKRIIAVTVVAISIAAGAFAGGTSWKRWFGAVDASARTGTT